MTKPLVEWNEDEILQWLWNEGVWTCGDDGGYALTAEEARVEVALQSQILCDEGYEVNVPGAEAVIKQWKMECPDIEALIP